MTVFTNPDKSAQMRLIQKYSLPLGTTTQFRTYSGPSLINSGASIFSGGSCNPFKLAPGAGWNTNNIWNVGFGNNFGCCAPGYGGWWGGGCCEPELTGWGKFVLGMQVLGGPSNALSLAGGLLSGIGKAICSLFGFGGSDNNNASTNTGTSNGLKAAFGIGGSANRSQVNAQAGAQNIQGQQGQAVGGTYAPQSDSSDVVGSANVKRVSNTSQTNSSAVNAKKSTNTSNNTSQITIGTQDSSLEPAFRALREYETAVEKNENVEAAEKALDDELNKIDIEGEKLNSQVEEAWKNKTEAEKAYDEATANNEAKEQLTTAAKARKEKETALRDAKNDASEAKTSLANAKSNLAAAGADIKPEEKTALEKAITDAEAKLKEAEQKVTTAEKELEEAKQAEDKAAEAVNKNDSKLKELYQKVKDTTDAYQKVKSEQEMILAQSSEIWSKKMQIGINKPANDSNENVNS